MTRPWWVRQWVIQELVLPPQAALYFGKFIAPWGMFAHAARNYDYHRKVCCQSHYVHLHGNDIRHLEHFSRAVIELDDLRQEWQTILRSPDPASGTPISLRRLLWQFRKREASDARNKVFALFPLVNYWGKHVAMYPEYGWTSQAIYRAATEKIVAVDGSLLVLMGSTEKLLTNLPTWVPDWTRKPSRFELERLERTLLFNASGGAKHSVRFMGESFMELRGAAVDIVSKISETMTYDDEDEALKIFSSWYSLVSASQSITADYAAGGSRLEAYWRTLCIDSCHSLDKEDIAAEKGQQYKRCSEAYMRDCMALWMDDQGLPPRRGTYQSSKKTGSLTNGPLKHNQAHVSKESSKSQQPAVELTENESLSFVAVDFAITSAMIDRRLFFTKTGYMGPGPSNMVEGDRVYVFSGAHVPFVVRLAGTANVPYVGSQATHELIGDCYVHGIMDGEVMSNDAYTLESVFLV